MLQNIYFEAEPSTQHRQYHNYSRLVLCSHAHRFATTVEGFLRILRFLRVVTIPNESNVDNRVAMFPLPLGLCISGPRSGIHQLNGEILPPAREVEHNKIRHQNLPLKLEVLWRIKVSQLQSNGH